jgi:hypothetical protein
MDGSAERACFVLGVSLHYADACLNSNGSALPPAHCFLHGRISSELQPARPGLEFRGCGYPVASPPARYLTWRQGLKPLG